MDESIRLLEQSIDDFLGSRDPVVSASRVIDPLLEIWGQAREVDPSVAVPVERLLTALVGRELTTLDELTGAMDEVRAAVAAQALPTDHPSGRRRRRLRSRAGLARPASAKAQRSAVPCDPSPWISGRSCTGGGSRTVTQASEVGPTEQEQVGDAARDHGQRAPGPSP